MAIDSSAFEEFLISEVDAARKVAENFKQDINLPISNSEITPILDFCFRLKFQAEKIIDKNEKLKILLRMGADPNVYVKYIGTPLKCALEGNSGVAFIEALVDANADINFPDENGNAALFFAAAFRRLDEIGFLIKRGALINQLNKKGNTILTEELNRKESSLDVVKLLIELGADVNASDSLHAVLSGWGKAEYFVQHIVDILIGSGADVNRKDPQGKSPLALAAAENKCPISILETLVNSGAVIDSADEKGWTPLTHASASGNAQAVKFLLDRKASVTHCDEDGKSALHWCCKRGHAAIVPLLVSAGADVNLADKKDSDQRRSSGGHTPLIYSVSREDVTKALLKYDPDVNLVDETKKSALMHAVAGYSDKKEEIIQILLKKGANVDLEDVDGNTALHLIAKGYNSTESAVQNLLDAKSDVNAKNKAGMTPLMLCRDVKAMKILIMYGAHLDLVDQSGKTALIHCLNQYGSDKHLKVKALLTAKCDLNIRDVEGKTALMYAVKSDSDHKSVALLVEHGADLDFLDEKGQPATAYADAENLMFLIKSGAKPSVYEGARLAIAIHNDNLPLSSVLLERGAQMKLSLAQYVKYKKIFEKLARANAEILRAGIVCSEPEAKEQFEALLAKWKRDVSVADEADLPEILRKGAWPVKTPLRKPLILPSARISYIEKSIDYFNGVIHWPDGLKETVLRNFKKYSPEKNTSIVSSAIVSKQDYWAGLLKKKGAISFSSIFKNWCSSDDEEFIKFWNVNAKAISAKIAAEPNWRRFAFEHEIEYLLARFDVAVLPGVLNCKGKFSDFPEVLLFVDAPGCASIMSRAMVSGSTARIARQWALKYPEACTKGLIVDVISKVGKDRSAAEVCLRFLASKGHRSVINNITGYFGDDVVESVAETLSQDHRADFMPAKPPKMPKFWSADVYPQPRLKSNNKELPSYAVDAIASMMSISNSEVRTPALDVVMDSCDPKSLANFAWGAFEEWASKGQKDSEWIFDSLTYFGDDTCARKLTPYIRNWPRENGIARARKGLEVLAAIGTDVALSQIQAISQKNKYQSVLESAQEMMRRIAVARDLKPHQLEDRLVPDCGLSEAGVIKLSFGGRYFIGSVDAALKPVIKDANGTVLKALPAAGKDDDKTLAKEAAATWSEFTKELKPIAKLQLERLELAMVQLRRWSGLDFKSLLVLSPLLQSVVKGLVWGVFPAKNKLSATFIVNPDNAFVDVDGNLIKVTDGSLIGIVHPLLMDEVSLVAWQKLFAKNKQQQPFAQLGRKIYRAIDDSTNTRFGLQGATVASKALKGLLAMGWSAEVGDAGWIWGFDRSFATGRASLGAEPGVHINDYEMSATEQKLEVSIPDTLSPMEFSETIRELMTLKK